jgi:hypothetical protein
MVSFHVPPTGGVNPLGCRSLHGLIEVPTSVGVDPFDLCLNSGRKVVLLTSVGECPSIGEGPTRGQPFPHACGGGPVVTRSPVAIPTLVGCLKKRP